MAYHVPVLLEACVEGLNINPDGIYVDVTYGAGGHSKSILKKLNANGHLMGFDQDEDAVVNALKDDRFTFVHANFRFLREFLEYHRIEKVDGIIADLGVSSHQLDVSVRGFSFRFDGPIDMRMNRFLEKSAADVLNQYSEEHLLKVFSEYGQVRNAKTLVKRIADQRRQRSWVDMGAFISMLDTIRIGNRAKYLAQVLQALRIEVNQELEALETLLMAAQKSLKPRGRLVVMSYHSLEDRLVKNFMKSGNAKGEQLKDDYGKINRPYKLISKGVIQANEEEVKQNPRARSARLRIAEKV